MKLAAPNKLKVSWTQARAGQMHEVENLFTLLLRPIHFQS